MGYTNGQYNAIVFDYSAFKWPELKEPALWPASLSYLVPDPLLPSSLAEAVASGRWRNNHNCRDHTAPESNRLPAPETLSSHSYEALRQSKTIRLLGIEAGDFDDELNLHFYYTDLTDIQLSYEALSYVWGSRGIDPWYDDLSHMAYIGGRATYVKANLGRALRALRLSNAERVMWVDAICINQNDLAERAHQVTLMSAIYQKASRVVVWLGEQSPTPLDSCDATTNEELAAVCDVVNRWLGDVPKCQQASYSTPNNAREEQSLCGIREASESASIGTRRDPWWTEMEQSSMQQSFGNLGGQDLDRGAVDLPGGSDSELLSNAKQSWHSPFWMAIKNFFDRSWFFRQWVLQEVVLARTAIARIGPFEINWRWVGVAAAILRTNHHHECQTLKLGGVYNAYLMYRMSRQSDLAPSKLDILRLLRLTRQFEVTDERDRVFGLLGIATSDNDPEHGKLFIKPNYKISKEELWVHVAVKILATSEDLALLSCVQYRGGKLEHDRRQSSFLPSNDVIVDADDDKNTDTSSRRTRAQNLPSWVPQWEYVFRTTISAWDFQECFSAARGLPRNMHITHKTGSLVLQGVKAGEIAYVSDLMSDKPDLRLLTSSFLRGYFETDLGQCLYAVTLTAGMNPYGSQAKNNRSVQADFIAYLQRDSRYSHDPKRPRRRELTEVSGTTSGDASRFSEMAQRVCQSRRLFLTTNGYLGLGPDILRAGDVVCVLGGGDTPFLLRLFPEHQADAFSRRRSRSSRRSSASVQKGHESGTNRYRLVGECFVEGLMKGEAIDAMASGIALQGPIPPDLIHEQMLQDLADDWRSTEEIMLEAQKALKKDSVAQQLERTWFDIR